MFRATAFLLSAGLAFGADFIVVNANVITVDPSKPYAEAFAVTNGRFAAVGTNAEIRALATPSTKIVDLHGMTVTPGIQRRPPAPRGRLRRKLTLLHAVARPGQGP